MTDAPTDRRINLQLTRTDWLVTHWTSTHLAGAHQLRWPDDGEPEALDGEQYQLQGKPSRRSQRAALNALAERWPTNLATPPTGPDLARTDIGFHYAGHHLMHRTYRELLLDGRETVDVALALPGEDMDEILHRMAGRCAQQSVVAVRGTRLRIAVYHLYRTAARPEPADQQQSRS